MKTIPKNAKQIATLKQQLTGCRVYTLDNHFLGKDTDPANAWAALESSARAKLTATGDERRFTVSVHSNLWYELTPAVPPPPKPNPAYERQQAEAAARKQRNGRVARDLAAYIRERAPETASDFEDVVEQWLRDNGGITD